MYVSDEKYDGKVDWRCPEAKVKCTRKDGVLYVGV